MTSPISLAHIYLIRINNQQSSNNQTIKQSTFTLSSFTIQSHHLSPAIIVILSSTRMHSIQLSLMLINYIHTLILFRMFLNFYRCCFHHIIPHIQLVKSVHLHLHTGQHIKTKIKLNCTLFGSLK